mmetsp:Transcript_56930/g.104067  ORF Transcript_56930/g.104067 Transcript_56930/m.104067 type:complete len:113 (+) Transcript_56930:684-1022(+)
MVVDLARECLVGRDFAVLLRSGTLPMQEVWDQKATLTNSVANRQARQVVLVIVMWVSQVIPAIWGHVPQYDAMSHLGVLVMQVYALALIFIAVQIALSSQTVINLVVMPVQM